MRKTKQALQRAAQEGHTYLPPGNMRSDAVALVARAFDIASVVRATRVELIHLWAALAYEPSAARSMWMGTLERPDQRGEARVRRNLLRRWRVPNLERTSAPKGPRLPLADITCRVLWRAADEASQMVHESIGPEHILLALVYTKHAELVRNQEAYSRTCYAIRKQIIAMPANRTKPLYGPVRASSNGARQAPKTPSRAKRRTA